MKTRTIVWLLVALIAVILIRNAVGLYQGHKVCPKDTPIQADGTVLDCEIRQ